MIEGHIKWMNVALDEATKGDHPFGAVIVRNDRLLVKSYDSSRRDRNPTAQAEMNAIRYLTRKLNSSKLRGCTLYATSEPGPMCAAACVWAGISEIVYGASITDLLDIGVSRIDIPAQYVIDKGFYPIKVTGGILKDKALKMFERSK